MLKDARAEVEAALQSAALARHQSCLCLLGLSDDDANYIVLFFVPPDNDHKAAALDATPIACLGVRQSEPALRDQAARAD